MRWSAAVGLALSMAAFGALRAQPTAPPEIAPAPAFTADQLSARPTDAWVTNGGDLANERYSPLDQINLANVKDLKGVWRAHLNGSGAGPRNSAEAQPLFYRGVLYIPTGDNDVFALDGDTGRVLWTFQGHPDPKSGAPVGWSSRGVALGDGMVFVSQIDAKLVALDQQTGKAVWSVQGERWQDGYSITSAPLYYNGLVITGFSGGEMAARGRVKAFDAKTGRLVWTFYTVPGPGEFGHDSWPNGRVWEHGGAPIWQTPAIDPKLGLLYFSTGNPGPDFNGSVRRGDDLFSVSIVALDAMTGRYRWHFQEVHHDLWDYDAPNPIVLFDATVGGRLRHGLVQVGKTGFAYILDRATGKPLIGIPEKPVMQEPRQATSATQPYPIGDAVVPQSIDIASEDVPLVNGGRIFTPFWTETVAAKPAQIGGANWPPSSYDPRTHQLFVCAGDEIGTWSAAELEGEGLPDGKIYMAGKLGHGDGETRGIFAALDLATNRLVWRRQWSDICYSGSLNTAGGLIFTGRNDGRFIALDKRTGDQVWQFQTGAGVNAAATAFDWKGVEYVALVSGGAVFAGDKHGDSVWLFSLKGTMNPPETPSAGPPSRAAVAAAGPPPDAARGQAVFHEACVACHGEDGKGGVGGGADLSKSSLSQDGVAEVVSGGRGRMPALAASLPAADIQAVAAYVRAAIEKGGS
jgi:quinohemoprotein ethanol dehydrogenase